MSMTIKLLLMMAGGLWAVAGLMFAMALSKAAGRFTPSWWTQCVHWSELETAEPPRRTASEEVLDSMSV